MNTVAELSAASANFQADFFGGQAFIQNVIPSQNRPGLFFELIEMK
jgi:hypothetical protein